MDTLNMHHLSDPAVAEVEKLLIITRDAQVGFAQLVAKAQSQFVPTAQRFHDLHARHAEALTGIIAVSGHLPDLPGSFSALTSRAVGVHGARFDDAGQNVMAQVRQGEQKVLAAFDLALMKVERGTPVQLSLAGLKAELEFLLKDTRLLG